MKEGFQIFRKEAIHKKFSVNKKMKLSHQKISLFCFVMMFSGFFIVSAASIFLVDLYGYIIFKI